LFEELRNGAVTRELFGDENRMNWESVQKGYVPFERRFAKNMIRFATTGFTT
jgi:hypothetical protein